MVLDRRANEFDDEGDGAVGVDLWSDERVATMIVYRGLDG